MLEGCAFDDVLLRPQKGVIGSRSDADISVPSLGLDIPIISAPMPSVASRELILEISRLGGMGVVHRIGRSEKKIWGEFYESAFIGEKPPAVAIGLETNLNKIVPYDQIKTLVLDVAHAHTDRVLKHVEDIKLAFGNRFFLIAGSVATYNGAFDLLNAGADALRVGIGPGSVCTTRQVTGFGVPQLEAIEACYNAANGAPIIADGGIRKSGDIVKALAAGADAVMIGGLFARSIEAGGLSHYGNASKRVNGHNAPEGIEETFDVSHTEPLKDIVKRLTWGLKSAISYAGATNIKELQANAEWIQLTGAGRTESKLV